MTRNGDRSASGRGEVAVVAVLADDKAVPDFKNGRRPGADCLAGVPIFQVHQRRGGPVRFDHNTAGFAGCAADLELLANDHLDALVGARQHLFEVPGCPFGCQQVRGLDQDEVLGKKGADPRGAPACLQGPDVTQYTVQGQCVR